MCSFFSTVKSKTGIAQSRYGAYIVSKKKDAKSSLNIDKHGSNQGGPQDSLGGSLPFTRDTKQEQIPKPDPFFN